MLHSVSFPFLHPFLQCVCVCTHAKAGQMQWWGNEWTGGMDGGIWCGGVCLRGGLIGGSMAIILDILMTAPGVETLKAHLLPLDYSLQPCILTAHRAAVFDRQDKDSELSPNPLCCLKTGTQRDVHCPYMLPLSAACAFGFPRYFMLCNHWGMEGNTLLYGF